MKDKSRPKTKRFHRQSQVFGFAFAASLASLLLYYWAPSLLEYFDERGRDVVFQWRKPPAPPEEVAVVAVDERSVKDYGRWPWPRVVQADLLRKLKQVGTGVIALDIVYNNPVQSVCDCPNENDAIPNMLQEEGSPIVGGYFFRSDRSTDVDPLAKEILHHFRIKQRLMRPGAILADVPTYPSVETNQNEVAQLFHGMGSFNRSPDLDGLVRRAPLLLQYDEELYPSLALDALSVLTGLDAGVVADASGVTSVRLGSFEIPVDSGGRLTLNFYSRKEPIPIYSAADVLSGEVGEEELAGRVVFVGVTEIGISDLVATPIQASFPGVAIHATVAANILQEFHLVKNLDTDLINVALMFLVPLLMVAGMAQLRHPWQMGLAFALILGAVGYLFYWLVGEKGLLVSVVYPGAAVLTAYVVFQTYYMLTSQRKNRFLTDAFGSYVSPDLVDQLLASPDRLSLTGERRRITVLFSDIRSFTTISESLTAEKLVEMLNLYLDRMSKVIIQRSGTLDKYIGDAIMALFNAPLDIPDHPRKAADSALAMLEELASMFGVLKENYDVDIHHGVGLHCGDAIVGNLGSTQRFDYTAIGDTVNLAARLEGLTKQYGVEIVISRAVLDELDEEYVCRALDQIQVKGKTVPVEIFELMGKGRALAGLADKANAFNDALELYQSQKFAAAKDAFDDFAERFPGDMPCQIYLERTAHYIESPPGEGWNGVFIATQK